MVQFKKMVVIGVGLIGGSLARVLREKGSVNEVVGVGRGEANLKRGVELGVLDSYSTDAREAVAGADLVFVATPVCTIPKVVAEIAPYLAPGCIVTDGGSVKETVVTACEPLMPEGTFFVGGHPIAGTEHSGVEASFSTLYVGRRCIVTPTANTDRVALEKVVELWKVAGSTVPLMDPVQHDLVVAAISHLPHMVAYSLVNAVDGYDRFGGDLLSFSAGGFRDFTRIASSDPVMWRDIALTNREAILEMMDFFSMYLEKLRTLVDQGDADGLQAFFLNSKQKRDAIL
ncbi:prephenate dehydrogenase/arogenate dehydrogenase family protein [Geomonas paludis]|uniref:prephenate dehydrogenase n=1 Tax=Geomonas paludis TaxID=2740185 RepID=A0A6V8MWD4_9BACT|nr:prephenate dehydrogenase/arogenate dehydrogenase family protein [Geomonas paludis]UPU35034.1 prephenate dehydrogenase/arogenate dehydrogenase family protein [Geomonas paludis]GFO64515.1 prephenate dehydrogenase [Geomonas paludis]